MKGFSQIIFVVALAVLIMAGPNKIASAALTLDATTLSGTGNVGIYSTGIGSIGIGTSTPGVFFTVASSTSNLFVVTGDGKVGIGTSTPSYGLTISLSPVAATTGALVQLGSNALTAPSGVGYYAATASGTYLVANPATFTGDFIHFQVGGDSKARLRAPVDGTTYGMLSLTNNNAVGSGVVAWVAGSLAYITQVTTEDFNFTFNPSIGLQVNNSANLSASHSGHYVFGAYLRARTHGTATSTGTLGGLTAVVAEAAVYSTPMNITSVIGVESKIPWWGSTGTTTSAYAFYGSPNAGGLSGSTVTNMYGLYLQEGKNSRVSNAWGIYQAGSTDMNYFAGNVGFATTTPTSTVQIGTPKDATRSYLQLDVVTSAPVAADCDSESEIGRMIMASTTIRTIYTCWGVAGWATSSVTF